ncbi:MAG: hypothetical protein Q4B67_03510 [Eubacteriales bacterium]|nr:hypothetical protein [Eubacteriales bacterium]
MKAVSIKAIECIMETLDKYKNELEDIQENEESEYIDQAIDDLCMVMEDLNCALEE